MQNKYITKKLEMGRMAGDLEKKKGLSKLLAAGGPFDNLPRLAAS